MRLFDYMSFRALIAIVLLSFSVAACTDRIEIKTDDAPPHLVIYGYITGDTIRQSVKITRSTGYFATEKPGGISNAIVTITSEDTSFVLIENPEEPGLYQTETVMAGVEGNTYSLTVVVDFDEDGIPEEYKASSLLPYTIQPDSIQIRPSSSFDDFLEVLLYGQLFEEGINYYSIHVAANQKVLNDSLHGFMIVDDEYLGRDITRGVACFYFDPTEDETLVYAGDTIKLRLDVLTKEFAEHINKAQEEISGSIPIFSGPPANIGTNIKKTDPNNTVPLVGFFSAYGGRSVSTIVTEKDVERFKY